jgi:hypothetical protein
MYQVQNLKSRSSVRASETLRLWAGKTFETCNVSCDRKPQPLARLLKKKIKNNILKNKVDLKINIDVDNVVFYQHAKFQLERPYIQG